MDGNSTPRPRSPMQTVEDPDKIAVLLKSMKITLGGLGNIFETLTNQSTALLTAGPTMHDASRKTQDLHRQLREHDEKQTKWITDIKREVRDDLKERICDAMMPQIQENLKTQVITQVQEEVNAQIRGHILLPLEQQVDENKRQLKEVNEALTNSAARKKNASLQLSNLDDPLSVVLKSDGTRSRLFPVDLRSLFSYDFENAKQLVKEYDLFEDEVLEVNFNRFLTHIGIQFQLVPV